MWSFTNAGKKTWNYVGLSHPAVLREILYIICHCCPFIVSHDISFGAIRGRTGDLNPTLIFLSWISPELGGQSEFCRCLLRILEELQQEHSLKGFFYFIHVCFSQYSGTFSSSLFTAYKFRSGSTDQSRGSRFDPRIDRLMIFFSSWKSPLYLNLSLQIGV